MLSVYWFAHYRYPSVNSKHSSFLHSNIGPAWTNVTIQYIPYLADAPGGYKSLKAPRAPFREYFAFSKLMQSLHWLDELESVMSLPHLSNSSNQRMLCIHSKNVKHSFTDACASRQGSGRSSCLDLWTVWNAIFVCAIFFLSYAQFK